MDDKWPKTFPPLSPDQRQISDDFVKNWLEVLPNKYGIVDRFNHQYPVRNAPRNFLRTLEIGAGTGEHLKYETLSPAQAESYVAVDIRENIVNAFKENHPNVRAIVGDCQERLEFEDGYFDRILAIHVLEHLPNLPAAVREMHRLSDKKNGVLQIVIPCEGSLAHSLARRILAQRIFEKRYRQSYRWFIEREHINLPNEIFEELAVSYDRVSTTFFPIPVKMQFCNLCIGATFRPRI